MAIIDFSRIVWFVGRNGFFKAKGMDISYSHDLTDGKLIMLHPITSRNNIANCCVTIPREDIDKLIDKLNKLKNG